MDIYKQSSTLAKARQWYASIHGLSKSLSFFDLVKAVTEKQDQEELATRIIALEFAYHFPESLKEIRYALSGPDCSKGEPLNRDVVKKRKRNKKKNKGAKNPSVAAKQPEPCKVLPFQTLGFERYDDYLKSPLWADIRERVLLRDNRACVVCKRDATHVHHRRYDIATMTGKNINMLVSICAGCHQDIHFEGKQRLNYSKTDKKLKLRLKAHRSAAPR